MLMQFCTPSTHPKAYDFRIGGQNRTPQPFSSQSVSGRSKTGRDHSTPAPTDAAHGLVCLHVGYVLVGVRRRGAASLADAYDTPCGGSAARGAHRAHSRTGAEPVTSSGSTSWNLV
jgi:hypothetical protein